MLDNVIPSRLSLARVVFVWLFRACAALCCAHSISSTAWSISSADARPLSHQPLTSAAIAVCTWQTVSSGFFPLERFSRFCQEQVADGRNGQVSFQPHITPPFVVVQSHLSFLILKTSFDSPTREGHAQQCVHFRLKRNITDEVFDFIAFQNVSPDQQMVRTRRKAVRIRKVNETMFHLANHQAFLSILETPFLPPLLAQVKFQQILDMHRRTAAGNQARYFLGASPTSSSMRSRSDTWWVNPSVKIFVNLTYVRLLSLVQSAQKLWFDSIPLVEGQPFELDTVGASTVVKLQSDLYIRPVYAIVRDYFFLSLFYIIHTYF